MIAKMRNIGEACTAANRFHVADGVADEFAAKLAGQARRHEGRARHRGGREGRPADRRRRSATRWPSWSTTPRSKGARCCVGGGKRDGAGYFFDPTVLSDVRGDARLLSEEIFGPVAPVIGFDSEDAAIAAANDTEYGLVAYVYTRDLKRAFRVCEKLQTGMVGLNQGLVSNAAAPFGGVKAVRLRPRGRPRGHRRVPVDQVRRDGDVTRPARAARALVRVRRGRRAPGARGHGARHRHAGRRAVRALRAAQGDRRARRRVLHELREPQGARARRQPVGRAGRPVEAAAAPGAPRGPRRAAEPAESDAYFATRSRGSQLGAWASQQSTEIPDREWLDARLARGRGGISGRGPASSALGRLLLNPRRIEFWEGRPNRLHDREAFTARP